MTSEHPTTQPAGEAHQAKSKAAITEPDDRNWKTVRPFLVGLVLFALLAVFDHSRGFDLWRNYALSGIFLGGLATWMVWHYDVRLPAYIQWTIVAGLLLHYVGGSLGSPDPRYTMGLFGLHGINGTYHVFAWWDNLTHGVGIGAASMGIAYLLEVYQARRGLRWSAPAVAAIAWLSGLAAGVGVELYEYLGKTAFQTIDQGGYGNTMADLGFNMMGATLGVTLAVTLDRKYLWKGINERWGAVAAPGAWWRRIPPGMTGYFVFVAVPAAATIFLVSQFLSGPPPADDLAHYDGALQVLLRAAVLGILGGLAAAMASREVQRRQEAAI